MFLINKFIFVFAMGLGMCSFSCAEWSLNFLKMPQSTSEKYSTGAAACAFVGGTILYHFYKLGRLWKYTSIGNELLENKLFDINDYNIENASEKEGMLYESEAATPSRFTASVPSSRVIKNLVYGIYRNDAGRFFVDSGIGKNAFAAINFKRTKTEVGKGNKGSDLIELEPMFCGRKNENFKDYLSMRRSQS